MYGKLKNQLVEELNSIKESGLYKNERTIVTPQGADIRVSNGDEVINFCANQYLGLSSHPRHSWFWIIFSAIYLWNTRYP